jgi:hypothetical protein
LRLRQVKAAGSIPDREREKPTGANTLSGFYYLAGLQAAGANPNPLSPAFHQRTHRLEIGIEAAPGAIVGVADAIAELRPFAAYITALGHFERYLR